jgi:hypothetical protein
MNADGAKRLRWPLTTLVVAALLAGSLAGAVYYWPREVESANAEIKQRSGGDKASAANSLTHVPVEASAPAKAELDVVRRHAWDRVARHLAPADAASLLAIERSLAPIDEFFAEHREGAKPFAKAVLSLRGKWKYVRTRGVFGGDPDEHVLFLDEKFREHVFAPEDLSAVVRSSIGDYVRAIQGIENKLLVTCRTELAELDPLVDAAIPGLDDSQAFADSYERMLVRLVPEVTRGASADLGIFVGSLVAAEVTEQLVMRLGRAVATRLGVSAGILGAGATGGAASAGITIGLAIVIDMGVERLLRLTGSDATSKVTARVEESLDDLRDLILDGDATAVAAYHKIRARRETFPTEAGRKKIAAALQEMEDKGDLGLRRMLFRLHYERARLREAALRKLILEGSGVDQSPAAIAKSDKEQR